MTFLNPPSVQAPAAYSNLNLQGPQLAARMGGTPSAAQRANLRLAWQDSGYRFLIHPLETAAGLVDANLTFGFDFGDVRRYGADATGVADSTLAFQRATNCGAAVLVPAGSFKVSGVAYAGTVIWLGVGPASKILSDAAVLTVTGGTGSFVDNIALFNITAPWIITRNPNNWAASATPTLQQSNTVLGYQPTPNDPEYATLVGLQAAVGTQNIGPVIQFTGAASDIVVSRIYGRFVRISLRDAINSTVERCDFRGGKGQWGAIEFDNAINNIQRGSGNQAIENRVSYASFSGIIFFSNDDGIARGNHCYMCGESGVKTGQSGGIAFTASVGGAVAGTLNANWGGATGTWQVNFADNELRACTLTNGANTITWSGALAAVSILNASVWGVLGSPASNMNPQCGRMHIIGNKCDTNYFDGIDALSTYGTTNDSAQTGHQVSYNYTSNNRGDGINADGRFNSYVGNHIFFNYGFGFWGTTSLSIIADNFFVDNNQQRNNTLHELLAVGQQAQNKISNNYFWGGVTQNNFAIAVTSGVVNYITDNHGVGNSTFSLGNAGAVASVVDGNTDAATGLITPQSFELQIVNTGGVIQHAIVSDDVSGTVGFNSSRINAASAGLTNTPTGADTTTAFAAGGKISSLNTNQFVFDTAAQASANGFLMATVSRNSTGSAVNVVAFVANINVNGLPRTRLFFQFANATTDATFALTTANIPAGKYLRVQFLGKLA